MSPSNGDYQSLNSMYAQLAQPQTITAWTYDGAAMYMSPDYKGYIKVDKGSPDKARYVIFYALLEEKDPMIFCKNKVELKEEMAKLLKKRRIDKASIRIFVLAGGLKRTK